MNRKFFGWLIALAGLAGGVTESPGQGRLTPPGPPGPTMKSLDQIEPRTVITNLPWTISASGGYVVDRNLSLGSGNGIAVTVSDVTLDLNGFVLSGHPVGSGHGIHVAAGVTNVTILNGTLRNWGGDGVHAEGAGDLVVRGVAVYGSGGYGFRMNKAELIDAIAKGSKLAGAKVGGHHDASMPAIRNVRLVNNTGGGLEIQGAGDVSISDSDISGNVGHGISWVSSDTNEAFRLTLAGVACDDNTGNGIHMDLSAVAAKGMLTGGLATGKPRLRASGNGGHGVHVAASATDFYLKIDDIEGELTGNGGDGLHVTAPAERGRIQLGGIRGEFSRNAAHGLKVAATGEAEVTVALTEARCDENGEDGVRIHLSHPDSRLSLEHRGGSASRNTGHGYNVVAAGKSAPQGFFDITVADNGGSGFKEICSTLAVCRMDGITANNNGGYGLDLEGKAYWISRSDVANNGSSGIRYVCTSQDASAYDALSVEACRIHRNQGHGVHIVDPDGRTDEVHRVSVTLGTTISASAGHGLFVEAQSDSEVRIAWKDSYAIGNGQNGIHAHTTADARDVLVVVEGGGCDNNANSGLRLALGGKSSPLLYRVARASFSGNGEHGIHFTGVAACRMTDCDVVGNGGDGIRAERPAGGYDRWGELIFETGDLVRNGGAGLNIPAVVGSVTGTVVVTGGLVSGNATAGIIIADNGVKPGSVNRVAITGNGGHGIEVAGHDFRIEDNLVARNAGSGIRVTGTGAHIARNQCNGNVNGIELAAGSSGNALRENIFGGDASQTPIRDSSGGANDIAPTQDVETGTNPLGNVAF